MVKVSEIESRKSSMDEGQCKEEEVNEDKKEQKGVDEKEL
jgi:hypothetical protein